MKKAMRRLYGAALLLSAAMFIGGTGTPAAAAQDGVQLYYVTTPAGQRCVMPCIGYSWNCQCIHLPPIIVE